MAKIKLLKNIYDGQRLEIKRFANDYNQIDFKAVTGKEAKFILSLSISEALDLRQMLDDCLVEALDGLRDEIEHKKIKSTDQIVQELKGKFKE